LQIVDRLLLGGYRVRAAARREAKAKEKWSAVVEVVGSDITKPATLAPAITDIDHIIFTAGVTQRPASERLIRVTEHDGVRNTLAAARPAGFRDR
jgi:uncharacterized protein YbjT (DUF2867 family)